MSQGTEIEMIKELWGSISLTVKIGVSLFSVPFLCMILVFPAATSVYCALIGQPKPIVSRTLVFDSKMETKIVGEEYYLKNSKTDEFEQVEKSDFYSAITAKKLQVIQSYLFVIAAAFMQLGVMLLFAVQVKREWNSGSSEKLPQNLAALERSA